MSKQALNVKLDAAVIDRVKDAAIYKRLSLTEVVLLALTRQLEAWEAEGPIPKREREPVGGRRMK